MQKSNYPDLAGHRTVHQEGYETYKRLRSEVDRGKPDAAAKVLEFAAFWLKDHIMKHDHRLAEFLRKRG